MATTALTLATAPFDGRPARVRAVTPASVALFGLEMVVSGPQRLPMLTLDCAPGASFRLERSSDLQPVTWNLLAPVSLDESRLYFVVPETNSFMQFYRAMPQ